MGTRESKSLDEAVRVDFDRLLQYFLDPALDQIEEIGETHPRAGYLVGAKAIHEVEPVAPFSLDQDVYVAIERLRGQIDDVWKSVRDVRATMLMGGSYATPPEGDGKEVPVLRMEFRHADGSSVKTYGALVQCEDGSMEVEELWFVWNSSE